jgi:hypothetical protein
MEFELIKDFNTSDAWGFMKLIEKITDEEIEKLLEDSGCDEDLINDILNKQYPCNKYFVLNDYIDDGNNGYFRIRIWELKNDRTK